LHLQLFFQVQVNDSQPHAIFTFYPFALQQDCLRLLFGLIFILINLSLLVSNIFHFHVQLYHPSSWIFLAFFYYGQKLQGRGVKCKWGQVIDAFLMRISVGELQQ